MSLPPPADEEAGLPLAGAGVLIMGKSSIKVAQGEGMANLGKFVAAVGVDFSDYGPDPSQALVHKMPCISHVAGQSAGATKAAINQAINKAVEPGSELLLRCKSGALVMLKRYTSLALVFLGIAAFMAIYYMPPSWKLPIALTAIFGSGVFALGLGLSIVKDFVGFWNRTRSLLFKRKTSARR